MKTIDSSEKLSIDNIKVLMEATLRFEHIKNDQEMDSILFWDNEFEMNISLSYKSNWTLITIMNWITDYYSNEYRERGMEVAKKEIRSALGME